VTVFVLTVLLLLFHRPAADALSRWVGPHSPDRAGRAATTKALTIVVLVALVFALDPEVRALLLVVDMIGVDIFLMVLVFQGREILDRLRPLLRTLETWSRYPMPIPNRALIKQHPLWSLYATAQSIVLALVIFLPIVTVVRSLTPC
jgi:hypothetical protein